MADTKITEQLHVVPKADVDRMFEILYAAKIVLRNGNLARELRGIAYANTFLAERTHYVCEPDNG